MKMTGILSPAQRKRLWDYNYVVINESIIEPWLQPFWNWLISQIPLWWSCNAMTTIGLVLNVATTLLLVYYSPDAKQSVPAWAYITCAVGLWVYQTLDQIDGKQARRTKSDGPLEDLFDHGCDSVSQIAIILGSCVAMRLGEQPNWMLLSACLGSVLFYSAQWQWNVTGTFRFHKTDVTEGHYSILAVFIISALFGDVVWNTRLPMLDIEMKMVPLVICVIGGIQHLMTDFTFMFLQGGGGKNGLTPGGTSRVFPLFPLALVIVLEILLYALSHNQLYLKHICLYVIIFGLLASKVIMRLLVAHMTKSEMSLFCSGFIGPGLLFLNQCVVGYFNEYYMLLFCLTIVTIDVFYYTSKVAQELCDELNIYCYSSKPRPIPPGVNKKQWNGCPT